MLDDDLALCAGELERGDGRSGPGREHGVEARHDAALEPTQGSAQRLPFHGIDHPARDRHDLDDLAEPHPQRPQPVRARVDGDATSGRTGGKPPRVVAPIELLHGWCAVPRTSGDHVTDHTLRRQGAWP